MLLTIAELCRDTKHELVLPPHRFIHIPRQARTLLRLQCHVGIRDLGDGTKEEYYSKQEHEGRNTQVSPLHLTQIIGIRVAEEYTRCEKWRHDRANSLEGLRELKPEFRKPRWPTGGNEGVSGCFKCRQTGTDDEEGAAETAEAAVDGRGPEHECADAVYAEACDECPAISNGKCQQRF